MVIRLLDETAEKDWRPTLTETLGEVIDAPTDF
jgi:hypothetical protein